MLSPLVSRYQRSPRNRPISSPDVAGEITGHGQATRGQAQHRRGEIRDAVVVEIQQEAVLAQERIDTEDAQFVEPDAPPAPAVGKLPAKWASDSKPNWKIRSLFVMSPWPAGS